MTDARTLNAWRRWGYRLLPGDLYSYILHLRPAEWPIMAGHTLLGYVLAVGLRGAIDTGVVPAPCRTSPPASLVDVVASVEVVLDAGTSMAPPLSLLQAASQEVRDAAFGALARIAAGSGQRLAALP